METAGSGRISSRSRSAARSARPATELVVLGCNPLFAGLTARECKEIASGAHTCTFAPKEFLFIQGQPAQSLVLLQSGSVKLTQLSVSGKEVIVWMSGPGDAMGMLTDLPSCSHSCSARAMEQSKALVWEYSRLQMLIAQYPQLGKNICRILVSRVHELEERFREMATERVARRLALALIRLLQRVGKKTKDGIEISISREELAQLTGTTFFTISRILSMWAEMGVVVVGRELVLVPDPKRLEAVGYDED